jgi:hypothetical protein
VTATTRLRADAALYQLPPPRTGRAGRPRTKGDRLPELTVLAALVKVRWQQATVRCYDREQVMDLACWRCLWYGAFGRQPVQVVLVRPPGRVDGYDVALVSTDLAATPAELVGRYAGRWSVEVLFQEARQVAGVGQARNRTRLAVERTVPFGLVCLSLTVVWYALHGPAHRGRRRPPRRRALVSDQARPVGRRHARRAPPGAHNRPVSAISAGRAHPRGNPRRAACLGHRSRINRESQVQL